jgi:hypothetical protein
LRIEITVSCAQSQNGSPSHTQRKQLKQYFFLVSRGGFWRRFSKKLTATPDTWPNEDDEGGTADYRAWCQDYHSETKAMKFITVMT